MSALLIVGAGGHGRVVAEAALASGQWSRIAYLDDGVAEGVQADGWPVLGPVSAAPRLLQDYSQAVVAVGDAPMRLRLLEKLSDLAFELPVIVHPNAIVSPASTVASGSVILALAIVSVGANLGRGVIVNHGAIVDHDCQLADGVHVCPGASIAGQVSIGTQTWIGVGASIREGVVVGSHVTIGAGAAVVEDLPNSGVVVGVPARRRSV